MISNYNHIKEITVEMHWIYIPYDSKKIQELLND